MAWLVHMLVPIDLTAPSRCAVGLAACLGQATGGEALLLHVHRDQTSLADLALLDGIAQPMRDAGVMAHLRTARGTPATRICEEVVRRQSQLVVMGTRGETQQGARADGRGSVARAVMHDCIAPVIAVRPPSSWADRWLWRGIWARSVPGRLAFAAPAAQYSPLAREIAVSLRRALDRPVSEIGWSGGTEAGTVSVDSLLPTDIVIVEHSMDDADDRRLDETLANLPSVVVVVSTR